MSFFPMDKETVFSFDTVGVIFGFRRSKPNLRFVVSRGDCITTLEIDEELYFQLHKLFDYCNSKLAEIELSRLKRLEYDNESDQN